PCLETFFSLGLSFPFLFFGNGVSLCRLGWSAVAPSWLTATSASRVQTILLPQPPLVAGITGAHHHARLIFVFLVETGFHHGGQDDLKLLTSGDPPASASQSAGITDVSHGARLSFGLSCLLIWSLGFLLFLALQVSFSVPLLGPALCPALHSLSPGPFSRSPSLSLSVRLCVPLSLSVSLARRPLSPRVRPPWVRAPCVCLSLWPVLSSRCLYPVGLSSSLQCLIFPKPQSPRLLSHPQLPLENGRALGRGRFRRRRVPHVPETASPFGPEGAPIRHGHRPVGTARPGLVHRLLLVSSALRGVPSAFAGTLAVCVSAGPGRLLAVHLVAGGVGHARQELGHRHLLGALHQAAAEQRAPEQAQRARRRPRASGPRARHGCPEQRRHRGGRLAGREPPQPPHAPPQAAVAEAAQGPAHGRRHPRCRPCRRRGRRALGARRALLRALHARLRRALVLVGLRLALGLRDLRGDLHLEDGVLAETHEELHLLGLAALVHHVEDELALGLLHLKRGAGDRIGALSAGARTAAVAATRGHHCRRYSKCTVILFCF
uniref:Uncharacterized protein n=1 Tax=Macaca mulatta TaxID=9544 RepID=A0A5F7ZY73_MACMU